MFFLLPVFHQFYCDAFGHRPLCFYLTWNSLKFLGVLMNIFHQIWNVNHYFFDFFFLLLLLPVLSFPVLTYLYIYWSTKWCSTVLRLFIFLHSFFYLSVLQIASFLLICIQVHCFFILPAQIYCWAPLVNFLCFCTFQLQNSYLVPFLKNNDFSIFIDIFYLIRHCHHIFFYFFKQRCFCLFVFLVLWTDL